MYKREFHEVFEEERDLPEFGPLLTKMRVMNEQGESEMTVDQYEAASAFDLLSIRLRDVPPCRY